MSVDVIAGVMGAVDQSKATAHFQVATAQAGGTEQIKPAGFGNFLQKMTGKTTQTAANTHPLYGDDTPATDPIAQRKKDAMIQLEGALMTKMVDSMMPKSEDSVYGKGLAGDTWRGFAVEQMGKTLAKNDLLNFNRAAPSDGQGTAVSLFGDFASPNGMTITPFAKQG